MVMTGTMRPKLSVSGITLAVALAMVGWVAVPAQSGPPAGDEAGESLSTFLHQPGTKGHDEPAPKYILAGAPREKEFEERLARLEDRLEHLSALLDRVADRLGEPAERRVPRAPRAPRAPRPPKAAPPLPAPPPVPAWPSDPEHEFLVLGGTFGDKESVVRAYHLPENKLEALTALMVRSDVPVLVGPKEDRIEVHGTAAQHGHFKRFVDMIDGKDEVESYRLAPGKLEALTELMVLEDVPVLVQPSGDHIKVHGNTLVQDVFGGFVKMIDPSKEHHGEGWSAHIEVPRWEHGEGIVKGQARAIKQFQKKMKCQAKEIAKKTKKAHKKVKKTKKCKECKKCKEHKDCKKGSQEHVFLENLERARELSGEAAVGALHESLAALADNDGLRELVEMATGLAGAADHGELVVQKRALEAQVKMLEAQAMAFQAKARNLENQAREFEERARHFERRADDLEDQADEMRDEADDADEEEHVGLIAEAGTLTAEAAGLAREVEALEEQAEAIEELAEGFEEQAETFAEAAEAISEAVRTLTETVPVEGM